MPRAITQLFYYLWTAVNAIAAVGFSIVAAKWAVEWFLSDRFFQPIHMVLTVTMFAVALNCARTVWHNLRKNKE